MRWLFVGGMFPRDREEEIQRNSRGIVQTAANQLQWNLIDGIEQALGTSITLLSSLFVGPYPGMYSQWRIQPFTFSHDGKTRDTGIGFINVKGVELYHRMFRLTGPLLSWLGQGGREEATDVWPDVVVLYSAQAQFLKAARDIRRKYPRTHVCLVVPDLPEFMTVTKRRSFARFVYDAFMKEPLHRLIYRNMQHVDSFVLLTEPMRERIGAGDRPYIVVEGISRDYLSVYGIGADVDVEPKTIVYTGTLAAQYGILDLARAFRSLEGADYRLCICGAGDAEDQLREWAEEDGRIRLLGSLSHRDVITLQARATLLVNPRGREGAYTRYSFPSKTLEYMQSGRPVMMHRLEGIPPEYDPYLLYFEEAGPDQPVWETVADGLRRVCGMSPDRLAEIGTSARHFVLEQKNAILQGARMTAMITEVLRNRREEA